MVKVSEEGILFSLSMPWGFEKAKRGSYPLKNFNCERFEPRSHFKRTLSLIVRVNVVLNRTVVVDSD